MVKNKTKSTSKSKSTKNSTPKVGWFVELTDPANLPERCLIGAEGQIVDERISEIFPTTEYCVLIPYSNGSITTWLFPKEFKQIKSFSGKGLSMSMPMSEERKVILFAIEEIIKKENNFSSKKEKWVELFFKTPDGDKHVSEVTWDTLSAEKLVDYYSILLFHFYKK